MAPYLALLGKEFQFESKNYPNEFVRHRNYELWKDVEYDDGLFKLDSKFRIVPGLAHAGISFSSKNYPDHFIRHKDYQAFIHKFEDVNLYKQDATWVAQSGLADNEKGVSFESYNYPGHFLRHEGGRVRIDRIDGSELFKDDATWYPKMINDVTVRGEWQLVYGNDNLVASGEFYVETTKGINVQSTTTTSVTNKYSWEASFQAKGEKFGAEVQAMFKVSGASTASETGSSSWARESTITDGYKLNLEKGKGVYLWQWVEYADTADAARITTKTNLFSQTTTLTTPESLSQPFSC